MWFSLSWCLWFSELNLLVSVGLVCVFLWLMKLLLFMLRLLKWMWYWLIMLLGFSECMVICVLLIGCGMLMLLVIWLVFSGC